jgi:hypothetical protein
MNKELLVLGNSVVERAVSFCTTYGYVVFGKYYSHTIHTGTCDECKKTVAPHP